MKIKKTDSTTWRNKDQAWEKITQLFNSQTTECLRRKDSLRKYYENIKKTIRKEVAEEKKKWKQTGGGPKKPDSTQDASKELVLGLINQKTIYGLNTSFGDDADIDVSIGSEGIEISQHDTSEEAEHVTALETYNYASPNHQKESLYLQKIGAIVLQIN